MFGLIRFMHLLNGTTIMNSSLIATNTDINNNDPDIEGNLISSGYTLIGNVGNTLYQASFGDQYGNPNALNITGGTSQATPIDPLIRRLKKKSLSFLYLRH